MELFVLLDFWFVSNMMNVQSPYLSIAAEEKKEKEGEEEGEECCWRFVSYEYIRSNFF